MNALGIDVDTSGKREIIRRLARLKSVHSVEDGGMYREDRSYSQIHVVTTMTEDELDDWLYKYSPCDYVGVFEMHQDG
jgi:hypothetical protein